MRTEERREQIVDATLGLLEDHPVHAITTRQIAAAVGLTQPALFRHFGSREEILVASVARGREALAQLATQLVARDAPADELLRTLVAGLVDHATAHPWLPRLLFHTAAAPSGHPLRAALSGLPAMQRSLAAQLVRQGIEAGTFPPTLDADAAARWVVASVQGLILQAALAPSPAEAPSVADALVHALSAGHPRRDAAPEAPPAGPPLRTLDVRPILKRGADPLDAILAVVDALPDDGALLLTAPFRPGPLVALLTRRGLRIRATRLGSDRWELWIAQPALPPILDVRDLPAPEPMEVVLREVAALAPGGALVARTPRVPRLLLQALAARGTDATVSEDPDGAGLVHVRAR